MRINTGEFRIDCYDRYGGRLKLKEAVAKSHTDAVGKGEYLIDSDPEVHSFTVVRQVYNSLDARSTW